MKPEYDIVIVGAGVVGSALACALRAAGLRIALVDAAAPARFSPDAEFDLRVFALSPASRRILEHLGAWDTVRAARAQAYAAMVVWDATGRGYVRFDSGELGEEALGYIVENRLLQFALSQRLADAANVSVVRPAKPLGLSVTTDKAVVTLDDGRRLETRLLVAADGAASAVRRLAGIEVRQAAYGQQAIVAHVRTEKPHRATAWQRFMPSGPIALLPLSDGRASIVWSLDDARALEIRDLGDREFCEAAGTASGELLGRITATTPRASFPLQRLHAEEYVQPRLALIGDAAHVVHPLAGQGMNLGMLDAATLAEVILDARARGRDIGDLAVLRRYQRARRSDNQSMIIALDGFKRLFGNANAPLSWARNAGLCAVDRFTPLKRVFMRRAMGLDTELPALARS